MYFFTPDTIAQANKNIEALDSKFGGLLCVLHCLTENIEENVSYTIDGEKLRRQLSFVFDKEPKDSFDNAKPSYIIFAKEWVSTFFENYIKTRVDLLSCAVFFLRRQGFEREYTKEEVIDFFVKRFNLENLKECWFCDSSKLELVYNQYGVEDNQSEFYTKMNYLSSFKSILFQNVIQKSASDLKAAGQIQTLYSGSGVQKCFLLSDEPLDRYYIMSNAVQASSVVEAKLTPEWVSSHADEFEDVRLEAEAQYDDFQSKFAPAVLSTLSGEDLLRKMFYSEETNKENLCYYLEFHAKNRELFGSVAGGSAYKFNLFYQKKKSSWVTGSSAKPKTLTLDEAIVLGTEIRDAIVEGAKIIAANQTLTDAEGYNNLYNQLFAKMGRYINLLWVQKYYHMIFPDKFPVFYNEAWQRHVLTKLDIEPYDNGFVRMGQISLFVNECDVENVVFAQIIYKYFNMVEDSDNTSNDPDNADVVEETSDTELPTLSPRGKNKVMPLNFILYGAPGTGKTYATAEYAMAIIENRKVDLSQKTSDERSALMEKYKAAIKEGRIIFTTFHQSYGYEDFIQGLRPDTKNGGFNFVPVDGVFKRIADEAIKHGDKDYVIIIDEINRANISKVFGELITLIEEDKRWGEINALSVTLPSGQAFAVPNNLFIVGTMNSADKSISLIDAALRRRFDFIEVVPNAKIVENTVLKTVLERLNEELFKELDSTDLLVGHAYFMGKDENDLCDIMNHSIIPLLYEYFYDNSNKVKNILEKAIAGYNFQVTPAKVGRIKLTNKG